MSLLVAEKSWLTDPDMAADAVLQIKNKIIVPHPGQMPVLESEARFKCVAAGRRFGKTVIAAAALIDKMLERPNSIGWWVAPEYKNVTRGYSELVAQIPPGLLAKPAPPASSQNKLLHFKNGSVIEFYSAANADAMAGAAVDYCVFDEAGLVGSGDPWHQLIRPTLMDRGGGALFISTPRGKNWFWELCQRGSSNKHGDRDWAYWHRTSLDNPTIPKGVQDPEDRRRQREEEIEDARDSMPEMFFRQEILAEFISAAASIFNLEHPDAVLHSMAEPNGQTVFLGIDLAQKEDFTVLSASRAGDRVPVLHDRFNSLKWADQREKIRGAIRELQDRGAEDVRVGIDATGVGSAVVEELENEGVNLERITFTNKWKEEAVGFLARDLQNGHAHILKDQVSEFEHYEYQITPSGNYKFESSVGHDDEVSAKLIENWLHHQVGDGEFRVVPAGMGEAAIKETGIPEVKRVGEPDPVLDRINNEAAWGKGPGGSGRGFS